MDTFKAAMPAFLVSILRHVLVLVAVKFGIVASEAEIGEAAVWIATGLTVVIAAAWSAWGRKPKAPPAALIIFGVGLALMAGQMGGCANKPGSALAVNEETPITFADPSSTHSTAVLGQKTTTTTGPLSVETSKLDNEGLYETNAGGAAKQRGAFTIGRLKGMLSGSSDLDISGIEMAFGPEGDVTVLKINKIGTSNSAVQRAVNEGVVALVAQWQKSSDNEKDVLIKQLETQAKLGDVAASLALSIIKAVAGVP